MSDNTQLQLIEMNLCAHPQLTSYDNYFYCLQCGAFQSKDGQLTLKQNTKRYPALTNPMNILQSQWKNSFKYQITNVNYLNQRQNLISTLHQWSEKLNLSYNTFYLAVQYLDIFFQSSQLLTYQLFGASSLMLAAKTVELDERIPFISKLKRFTFLPYTTKEIKTAECHLIKIIGWKLQKTTLADWVDTISSIGFIFDGDHFERTILTEKNYNSITLPTFKDIGMKEDPSLNSLKYSPSYKLRDLFQKIERITKSLTYLILNETSLIDVDQQTITLSTIKYVRSLVGLKNEKFLEELFPDQTLIDLSKTIPSNLVLTHKFNAPTINPRTTSHCTTQEYSSLQFRQPYQIQTTTNLYQ